MSKLLILWFTDTMNLKRKPEEAKHKTKMKRQEESAKKLMKNMRHFTKFFLHLQFKKCIFQCTIPRHIFPESFSLLSMKDSSNLT